MVKICDLHTHSTYSDGTCTPAELIRLAREANLEALALSDHNTVAGLPSFLAAAEGSGIEPVPSVEFSTEFQNKELHILAFYVQPEHYAPINARLQDFLDRKDQSNFDLVQRLKAAGVELDYGIIREKSAGNINRAVIAAEMVELGYCESIKEAFSQWLSPKRGYYVPATRPDAYETIRFIKSIGAVAVLAHPFLSMDESLLRAFLPEAVDAGLDGMEVYYSTYDEEQTRLALEIAAEYGLLGSGGSDFHGQNKPDISIGVGKGNLSIPLTLLQQLKSRRKNILPK